LGNNVFKYIVPFKNNTNTPMKTLFIISLSLLACLYAQAQNSFKLLQGTQLTYQVTENGKISEVLVTIEEVSPNVKFSYKTKIDNLVITTPANESFPVQDLTFRLMLMPDQFDKVRKLETNFRDNPIDTSLATLTIMGIKGPKAFGAIGFEHGKLNVNGTNLDSHNYRISETTNTEGTPQNFGDKGILLKVNKDKDFPYVVMYMDPVRNITIELVKVTGAELYEYIW
jgi:hypothetical protein